MMTARFMFDDYIRCMSAKQRLHRRRTSLRHIKLQRIAQLLELPVLASPPPQFFSMSPPSFSQPSIASPQGFRSRPGGAVCVSSVPQVSTDPSLLLETVRTMDAPADTDVSVDSAIGDHRMAAPESCLHPSRPLEIKLGLLQAFLRSLTSGILRRTVKRLNLLRMFSIHLRGLTSCLRITNPPRCPCLIRSIRLRLPLLEGSGVLETLNFISWSGECRT